MLMKNIHRQNVKQKSVNVHVSFIPLTMRLIYIVMLNRLIYNTPFPTMFQLYHNGQFTERVFPKCPALVLNITLFQGNWLHFHIGPLVLEDE